MKTKNSGTMQFILVLCLPVLLAQTEGSSHSGSDSINDRHELQNTPAQCQYEYTEQPPHQIQCNPYVNSQLKLECTIEAPLDQFPQVVWFRSRFHQDPDSGMDWWIMERLDGTLPGILVREQHRVSSNSYTMRSQIQISDLDSSDIGDYWCRMVVGGTQWLVPSDTFFLQRSSAYSQYSACTSRFAQSKLERKCAAWDPNSVTTQTLSTTNVDMSPATITEAPITTTVELQTTLSQRTTGASTTASTTDNMVESEADTSTIQPTIEEHYMVSLSTVSSTLISGSESERITTEEATDSTEQRYLTTHTQGSTVYTSSFMQTERVTDSDLLESDNSRPSNETPDNRKDRFLRKELYISVAVLLLFGILILILIPVIVCLCIRKRNKIGIGARQNNYIKNQATNDPINDVEDEPLTPPLQAASDYLVPLPTLNRQLQHHNQFRRLQQSRSGEHGYETSISLSHEYEDIPDLMESKRTHSYENDGTIKMKRNAAYKVNRTWDSRRGAAIQCHDMVIPNPMNCFYYNNCHIHEQEPSTTGLTRL